MDADYVFAFNMLCIGLVAFLLAIGASGIKDD
jgi:hypothetical protein